MRELLNDLEAGHDLSYADPVERVRAKMRTPLPRRFYETVEVAEVDGGFRVLLDGKVVRTPGRGILALPTRDAARLVADEFSAQADVLDLPAMPLLRLANTAIDGVAADPRAVLEDILRYASCDLVCYRADAPDALVARQAEAWDPVLDWARAQLSVRLVLAGGVMHVDQPREALAALGVHLRLRADPFRLTAMHVITSLTGSALLSLAVEAGAMDAEAAWLAAHVDEDWNIEQWGEDAEATAQRAIKRRDMMAAALLLEAIQSR